MRVLARAAMALTPCLALLVGVTAAPAPPAGAAYPPIPPGPILIGVSTSLTGAAAAYGAPTVASFENVTFKDFDARHPNGVRGHQLELKVYNDNSTVTGAVQAAQQMVSDHVAGVATLTTNPAGSSQQVLVLNKNKVPIVSTLTGSQYSNTKAFPYAFSPAASVQQEGAAAGQWVKKKGYTKIASIVDTVSTDQDTLNQIYAGIKKYAPKAKIVKAVTVPAGSTDYSVAVTQLKAANPQLLLVYIGLGYGPLWQGMQTQGWSPNILSSAGAWYDGFSAMGPLVANATATYVDCAPSPSTTFSPEQQQLFQGYSDATDGFSINYLTFIASDSIPVELLAYAINKYNTLDPAAIKKAIEGIHNKTFLGLTYNYSPTNHYGITGVYSAAVCAMGPPYAGGVGKVPIRQ
jgi:branched-chain amino acid transport system substrate-binding protein